MSSTQFDHVTVIKNQMFILVEHVSAIPCNLKMERKTLGVILPTEQPLTFETHVPERMEIISGECRVKIADSNESELFRAGQSFYVPGNSVFKIETDEVLDYVCHLEG